MKSSKWIKLTLGLSLMALPSLVSAKKPSGGGLPDLAGDSITFKSKCKGTSCTVQNLTLLVDNLGLGDANNTAVEYYLSDDTTLTTDSLGGTTETDTLIHTVSLGTVKANRTKKRTLGGGLLKQVDAQTGQYVIALLDAHNEATETNEQNNVFVSPPLP